MVTPIDKAGFLVVTDVMATDIVYWGKMYPLPQPLILKGGERYRFVPATSGECPVALEVVPARPPKSLLV